MPGFTTTFAVEHGQFVEGMDRLAVYGIRTAKKMGVGFNSEMDRVENYTRRTMRLVQRHWQDAWRIGSVAAAAGGTAMFMALSTAAEGSERVRSEFEAIRGAWDGMVADIGREATLGDASWIQDTTESINDARKATVDWIATVNTFGYALGNVKAANEFLETEKALDGQITAIRAFMDKRDALLAGRDGAEGRQAKDRLARRRFASSLGDDITQGQRYDLLSIFDENAERDRQDLRERERLASRQSVSVFGTQLRRIEASGLGGSDDPQTRIIEARTRARHEEIEAYERLWGLEGVTEGERFELIQRSVDGIRARMNARIEEIEQTEAQRRREEELRQLERNEERRIETLRARGRGHLADILKEDLEARKNIREINANDLLTEEQRADSVRAVNRLLEARVGALREADALSREDAGRRRREADEERRMQDLRERGSTRVADAKRIELEARREIRSVLEDELLTESQKRESIALIGSSSASRIGRLSSPTATIGPGFFGDAATRAQILGPGAGDGSGDSPVVSALREVKEVIETTVADALTEIAGPRPVVH